MFYSVAYTVRNQVAESDRVFVACFRVEFVSVVAEAVCVLSARQLATPLSIAGSFSHVKTHFNRIVGKNTFLSLEDKLQVLTAEPSSSAS
jgi:hypothetical protein